jgi:hypothetical protein
MDIIQTNVLYKNYYYDPYITINLSHLENSNRLITGEKINDATFYESVKRNSVTISRIAAMHGHIDVIKYLYQNKFLIHSYLYNDAANYGHLECLKYICENIFLINFKEYVCDDAASNGHLDCLAYAHSKKYPWNHNTCYYAARNGHLNCLDFLHKNGCKWNINTLIVALQNKRINCIKYCMNNGLLLLPSDKDYIKNFDKFYKIIKKIINQRNYKRYLMLFCPIFPKDILDMIIKKIEF